MIKRSNSLVLNLLSKLKHSLDFVICVIVRGALSLKTDVLRSSKIFQDGLINLALWRFMKLCRCLLLLPGSDGRCENNLFDLNWAFDVIFALDGAQERQETLLSLNGTT